VGVPPKSPEGEGLEGLNIKKLRLPAEEEEVNIKTGKGSVNKGKKRIREDRRKGERGGCSPRVPLEKCITGLIKEWVIIRSRGQKITTKEGDPGDQRFKMG